ncbi:MAG: sugar ABC transporter ATP-binding protein [Gammaproteobacteria bacterium]|nr:sugar ABC transporter ATP-binding protein [Gammaproteobacteria bacterium]
MGLLTVQKVSKSFPGVRALQEVDFELKAGEVHALLGENGAGKSTLMKILAGIYQKDQGRILVDGQEVEISSPSHAKSLSIGIIHQELCLLPHLTVAQNIFLGREPRKWKGLLDEKAINDATHVLLAYLKLNLDPKKKLGSLTIAKQQLVEIAKVFSNVSKILIMDEPTATLNHTEVQDLFRIIQQLKSQGVGIIYISHKMDEIQQIADRITVLRDGRYIDTVPIDTPINRVIALMVGRDIETKTKTIPDTSHSPIKLKVENVSRGDWVKNVSFNLRKGEILGFAGLMGAGRTELARLVFGADKMDCGKIYIDDQVCTISSPVDAVKAGIAYLSEDRKRYGLATDLTVETNITLVHLAKWLRFKFWLLKTQLVEQSAKMVEKLGIKTPNLEQKVRFLSGGNQQKIVIAKWLLRDSDILIFDEPTRGIDVGAKAEIYQMLDMLAQMGKAIIVISSELPEVMLLSHRILVMCEGKITGEVPGEKATQEWIMSLATQRG